MQRVNISANDEPIPRLNPDKFSRQSREMYSFGLSVIVQYDDISLVLIYFYNHFIN